MICSTDFCKAASDCCPTPPLYPTPFALPTSAAAWYENAGKISTALGFEISGFQFTRAELEVIDGKTSIGLRATRKRVQQESGYNQDYDRAATCHYIPAG